MADNQTEVIKQEINKAINFLGQNKFTEAENTCLKIIGTQDNADAFHILSSIKIYQQEFEQSIEYVKKSIEINSDNAGYHVTLGCAYSSMKDYKNSISAFENAIKLNDNVAQVHFYLGESLRKLKKYNDAISCFYKTLELSPEHTGAYMLLGVVYQEKKQFDLSIKSFEKCLEIMPNYAEAHLNLGLCYLLVGDYENGWREYEWRRKIYSLPAEQLKKEWSGQSLDNKTLLIIDEGSNENLIHFIRFAKDLKKDGCKIILRCNENVSSLMSMQEWIDDVNSETEYPEHDYYIYIGSIMNVLKYNPNYHKQHFPYIKTDEKRHHCIKPNQVNIGLVLETDRASNAHDDESVNSSLFVNIFKKEWNVIYLDNQVDESSLPTCCNSYASYSDIKELSQIINQLDLVITVDHLVGHISGALNIDTILMLPCVPNWRWDMNHRNNSPWYESMRLFRQQIPDDWGSIITNVTKYLESRKYG